MFKSVRVRGGKSKGDVLVVGQFKGRALDEQTLAHDPDGTLADAGARKEATGELGRIVEATPHDTTKPSRLLILGLGERDALDGAALRTAAGMLGRKLAQLMEGSVDIDLAGALTDAGFDIQTAGSAVGEGLGLIGWNRDQWKGSAATLPDRVALKLAAPDTGFSKGMKRGIALAESANVARTLSETPPNEATPLYIAERAKELAEETGMTCRVIKGAQLGKERMVGHVNVGKASENEPCLIRLEYRPEKAKKNAKPAVLVGKTITYDSGGLSLKINNSMRGMKRDKDGGCAVFGAMHAIATVIKPRRPVVALLACAENAISDEAYRPDDVLTFRNGVTVEVTNTDAEGRLVLADALCWACDKEKPGMIVDMATLTGGVVVALGSTYAGLWCDDDDLRARIEEASLISGERVWRLPHHTEYRDMLKSDVADILNSAPVRKAHPIQAAAFLSYFVKNGTPWAHIDIAGTHAVDSDTGPYVRNAATGFGTRLVAELLDRDP